MKYFARIEALEWRRTGLRTSEQTDEPRGTLGATG
jgi:hypothetical protein